MPAEPAEPRLFITGSIRIDAGDKAFQLRFDPGRIIVGFQSFAALLWARNEGDRLATTIREMPPLPNAKPSSAASTMPLPAGTTEIIVTVNSRPVGKLLPSNGRFKFRPTPLAFLTKRS